MRSAFGKGRHDFTRRVKHLAKDHEGSQSLPHYVLTMAVAVDSILDKREPRRSPYTAGFSDPADPVDIITALTGKSWSSFKHADVYALTCFARDGTCLFRSKFQAGVNPANPISARYTCKEITNTMGFCAFELELRRVSTNGSGFRQ